ncbi:MAG: hypothetical protein EG825_07340 [Rhodocyclaceae bacterium]|nr:hypothetical protein [Rhodocyclaceae bacterium]
MAKANSTRAQIDATPTERVIVPMIAVADSTDLDEVAHSVSNVLAFMATALRDGFDFGGNRDLQDGAGLILEACANTINVHFREGGVE